LRLASNPGSFVSWVAGLYYFKQVQHNLGSVVLGLPGAVPLNGNQANIIVEDWIKPSHKAAFGQVTVPLGETTRLTGGLRYSRDTVVHPQNFTTCIFAPCNAVLTPFEKTFSSVDYLLRLEQDLTKDNLLYFSASSGYRPGNLASNGQAFDNEKLRAWELGSKNTINGIVTLNSSLFYYDYPKYQSSTNIAGGPPGSGREMEQIFYTAVLPVEYYGIEVQATWLITSADVLSVSPIWLHTRFKANTEFPDYSGGPISVVPTKDEPVPRAPTFAVDANYQHTFRLGNGGELFAGADVTYKSKQVIDLSTCYYSPSAASCDTAIGFNPAINENPATHVQKAYTLYGVSTGWKSSDDKWKVSAYGRNLGDKRTKLLYNAGALTVSTGRTYGMTLTRSW
jgi:iron complex outermembrane receptor protein